MDFASVTVVALLTTLPPAVTPLSRQQTTPFANALLHPPRLAQSTQPAQSQPKRDSLKNGALIGLAVGAVTGVFLGAVGCGLGEILSTNPDSEDCGSEELAGALIFGAAGLGIGAGIDALFERAPSVAGAPAGMRKGVRVRLHFGK